MDFTGGWRQVMQESTEPVTLYGTCCNPQVGRAGKLLVFHIFGLTTAQLKLGKCGTVRPP